MRCIIVLSTALLVLPRPVAAQQATAGLRAVVTAADTGEPIPGATVRVGGEGGRIGRADAEGHVRLGGIPAGTSMLTVEAPGYAPAQAVVTFAPLGVLEIEVSLEVAPIPVAPVEVSVERQSVRLETAGFYDRAETGLGDFLTPEMIEERVRRSSRLSDLLRGVTGIRIVPTGAGAYAVVSTRGQASITRPCVPRIWIDAVRLPTDASRDINSIVNADAIAGIEVFAGATDTPTEFNPTGSPCGTILIWTGPRHR